MTASSSACFSGLVEYLRGKQGVQEVELKAGRPASHTEISSWEKKYGCVLPEDVRVFYLTHNGVHLHWSCLHHNATVPAGRIQLASLSELRPLVTTPIPSTNTPSLLDLELEEDGGQPSLWSDGKSSVMLLDYCSTCGHTCLVITRQSQSEHTTTKNGGGCSVWLLDLGLSWHQLTGSFSDYLRLATVHLGLLQWHYALTTNRLSPQYEYWFHVFAPHRLEVDFSHLTSQATPPNQGPDMVGNRARGAAKAPLNVVDVSKILQVKPPRDKSASVRSKSASSRQPSGQGASSRTGAASTTKN